MIRSRTAARLVVAMALALVGTQLGVDELAAQSVPAASAPQVEATSTEFGPGDFFDTGEQLIISVTERSAADQTWTLRGPASVLMQNVTDTDLVVETLLERLPSEPGQMAGILVSMASDELLRFDLVASDDGLQLRRTSRPGGSRESVSSVTIEAPVSNELSLRLVRTGSTWSLSTSLDRISWQRRPSLDLQSAGTVRRLGPFAAVETLPGASTGSAAAYSAVFGSFLVNGDEPSGAEQDLTVAEIFNVRVEPSPTSLSVAWETTEPTVSHVEWGIAGYPNDEGTGALGLSNDALLSGLDPATTYQLRITAADHNGNQTQRLLQATTLGVGPAQAGAAAVGDTVFDLWYGGSQKFGKTGTPQRWVNLLGKVSDPQGIKKLEYKIGGGGYKTLSVGADLRRLAGKGDFNADILGSKLGTGTRTITLRVTDNKGKKQTKQLKVERRTAKKWPLPYAINWSALNAPTDALQIVDGNWVLENNSLTLGNLDAGYDRLAALGDTSWKSYEVLVPFTVNSISPNADDAPSNGPGVGVIMHWNGHNKSLEPTAQPLVGFKPLSGPDPTPVGAILWWHDTKNQSAKMQITDHYGAPAVDKPFGLQTGKQYFIRARGVVGSSGVTYSMKLWGAGATEPQAWSLTYKAGKKDREPQSGSLVLVSHEVDVSYGNVIVTPAGSARAVKPVVSPGSGVVGPGKQIKLSSTTGGAKIYYTVDGSTPSPLSAKYSGPFTLSGSATVRAIAYAVGFDPSTVATAALSVNEAPVVTTGAEVAAGVGKAVTIKATVTDDGISTPLTVKWAKTSGPGTVSFASSNSANTTAVFSKIGKYVLRVTASDGALSDAATLSVVVSAQPPAPAQLGYWMLEADGDIYGFGDSSSFAPVSLAGATALAFDRSDDGSALWVLDSAGRVHVRGTAKHFGNVDLGALGAGESVASISVTTSGNGYWVFTDRGRALNFGDAAHFGDLPTLGILPAGPVVASSSTPSGNGYYMLGSDGGVFAFGDAKFVGSIPQVLPPGALACPIVGLVPVPTGDGYWMVACDGGVFAFGNAPFVGSIPAVLPAGTTLNSPINGLVPYGAGYLMVASDGGVFSFSDQVFLGSLGDVPLNSAITAITAFVVG